MVTTAQIAESLRTCMGTFNHYIPVAKPWDGPEQDFIIPPYVLGVFLGDGDHVHGTITSHKDDAEEMAENLRACGEIVDVLPYADGSDRRIIRIRHDWNRCPYGHERPRGTHDEPTKCMRCHCISHAGKPPGIPPRQRLVPVAARGTGAEAGEGPRERPRARGRQAHPRAVLPGIASSSASPCSRGSWTLTAASSASQGSLTISLHHERLAKDLYRLVCSLGHKAVLRESTWKSSQLGTTGTCWRMSWSSPDPAFRLARKAALQRTDFGDGDGRSNSPLPPVHRGMRACRSVPVRCIVVDSHDHRFCITDSFIATCNSAEALAAARDGLDRAISIAVGPIRAV